MKLPDIGGFLDKQISGVKAIKNGLGLLALIILAAEVILIIALVSTPTASSMYNWYVPLMLVLLVIIVISYFYDRYLTAQSNDFYKLKKIEKKIVGHWWEFLHNHKTIILSISEIHFDPNQLQFVIQGKSYDSEGQEVASWKSNACAVINLSSPEFHYFWKGIHFSTTEIDKSFSGVGVIQFPSIDDEKEITRGEGWFTSGNISELKFTGQHKIEFIRCSREEIKVLSQDNREKQELIQQRYSSWKEKFTRKNPVRD
jgi:hypothetical protein